MDTPSKTKRVPTRETVIKREIAVARRQLETNSKKLEVLRNATVDIEQLELETEELIDSLTPLKAELIKILGLD
jgi:hypothetical protein